MQTESTAPGPPLAGSRRSGSEQHGRARPGRSPRPAPIVLALAVVALAAIGWRVLGPSGPGAHDMVGRTAPDAPFTTFEGAATSLGELRGRPLVVNFWGSWCHPCIEEMPAFEQVHRAVGDRVRFVGLAVRDAENPARARALGTGVTYGLGFDPDGRVAAAFGLVNLPATVLIAADGTVRHLSQGPALTAEELTRLVEAELLPAGGGA